MGTAFGMTTERKEFSIEVCQKKNEKAAAC